LLPKPENAIIAKFPTTCTADAVDFALMALSAIE
jgi:hypothetical protein